jgi:acyl carrier protein
VTTLTQEHDRIVAVIANTFVVDASELTEDTLLRDELGADSLMIVEVLNMLEEMLGVQLPDSDAFLAELQSVGDVCRAFDTSAGAAA